MQDVIVIGGSYAGMAAALQLVRARRAVTVIDAGERRNRFAGPSHGFLGQDGIAAAEIAATARRQLEAYPTLSWIDGRAVAVNGGKDDFTVTMADGRHHHGRRLLFATGLADQLPEIPGLAERWGTSVFHCPYCHGYELDRGRIGVIATGPMSAHQAEMVSDWGTVTFLTNGAVEPDAATRQALAGRAVSLEPVPISRIDGVADVVLDDGRRLGFAGLFTAPHCVPSSPLAAEAGCALEETPMGVQIRTDAAKQTSLAGVFACGDVARMPHSVTLAVADGAWAGAQLHRSLLWPDA
ncbi:NAD(P)/FAD-dependent oxidoreductase [Hoeflea olei]|uniref:Thioredoxin reductase n=1 Tax=Hoeflea olei TaxID=1480615 RepID=A0A1C1YYG1_9HYPH|nr:NAD(P)/FAD-dependent oxidoreductase [Hoeflea olei]OCW58561.1 thioredoxin reductase [Hoeflea olei]